MTTKRSVLITGLARDVGEGIASEIHRLVKVFQDFDEISFFVVESDSDDDTVAELERIRSSRENFDFVTLGSLRNKIPDRIARIAFCRDVYMDELRTNSKYKDISFICMVDFDLDNDILTPMGIESCFKNLDWCGLFANQKGAYYDIFALRAENWSENNCWDSDRILREQGLNPHISQHIAVYSKRRRINKNIPWIPVKSAFGGFGIYRRSCIADLTYQSTGLAQIGECEHVSFNAQLINNGHKLFINPKLLNFSWNNHNNSERFLNRYKRRIRVLLTFFRQYFMKYE